jgi:hypothetical protein
VVVCAGLAPEGIRIGAYAAAHLDTPRQRGPLARQGSMAGGGGGATGGGWGSSARGLQREASGSIKRRRTMTGEDEAASGGARIDRQVCTVWSVDGGCGAHGEGRGRVQPCSFESQGYLLGFPHKREGCMHVLRCTIPLLLVLALLLLSWCW